MLRKAFFALALVAALSTSAFAETNVAAGHHVFTVNTGLQTFPVLGTSNSGETLAGMDLYLVMDALGPIITNVDLINGTVFQPNNTGQQDFGGAFPAPGHEVWYNITTASGSVPTGIVALVTIDTNSAAAGQYLLSLESEIIGASAVYNQVGVGGTFTNGSVTLVPEPGTVVMALFGAAGLGLVAIRRRRRNA